MFTLRNAAGLSIAALTLANGQSASAQDRDDETIVVTGDAEVRKQDIRGAVRDIAMRGRNQYEPIAQYQKPLCVEARGLGEAGNTHVAERIAANTADSGVEVGEEGCEVNALVVVVDDPAKLIDNLRETQPQLFGLKTNRLINAALNRGDPAIAWSAYQSRDPNGLQMPTVGGIGAGTGSGTLSETAGQSVTKTNSRGMSRFQIPYSIEKVFTVMVFDVETLIGAHLDQVADFSTMRILADPQRRIELEDGPIDTILTLFATGPEEAPAQLTDMDRAFLRGLYTLRPNSASNRLNSSVIAAYEELANED